MSLAEKERKKFLVSTAIPTQPKLENSKKIAKNFKKLKKLIPTLFLSKTG